MIMRGKEENSDADDLIIMFYRNITFVKFEFLFNKNKRF